MSMPIPDRRAARAARRDTLRALKRDIADVSAQIVRGQHLLATASADADVGPLKAELTQLERMRIITTLTLEHVEKVLKDSTRTGKAKDAIVAKLKAA